MNTHPHPQPDHGITGLALIPVDVGTSCVHHPDRLAVATLEDRSCGDVHHDAMCRPCATYNAGKFGLTMQLAACITAQAMAFTYDDDGGE